MSSENFSLALYPASLVLHSCGHIAPGPGNNFNSLGGDRWRFQASSSEVWWKVSVPHSRILPYSWPSPHFVPQNMSSSTLAYLSGFQTQVLFYEPGTEIPTLNPHLWGQISVTCCQQSACLVFCYVIHSFIHLLPWSYAMVVNDSTTTSLLDLPGAHLLPFSILPLASCRLACLSQDSH